jgi:DNA-nicking Smr family endonuclease
MKKRKPPERPQSDFKNTPFKSLKGLPPSTAVPAKQPTPPQVRKQPDSNDEDEALLFLRAAEGAKKFGPAPDKHIVPTTRQAPEQTQVRTPEDSRLFLAAMKKIGTAFHERLPEQELEEAEHHRSPTSRMRQLKRGDIRIRQELDLHGFLKDEALVRLEQFIAAARSRRQQAVLVITGKGLNSPEGPVLHGAVAAWLRNKGKGLIAEFVSAPRELGGSGAFVVFLKKK